jgi:histidyl-tRNA synthetase
MISRVKGTQDFLDLTLYDFIIDQARAHLAVYNFTHVDTPILEHLELFQRSLGEHTDVVSKEMFIIESKGDTSYDSPSDKICLRPEATASIARAFVENGVQQTPWKVFTYGPMFRYERPQKGRYREFHQMSIEVIGSNSMAQDAQYIKMLDRFFHEKLKLNNYALLLNFIGCSQDRKAYLLILKEFLNSSAAAQICDQCLVRKEHNVLRIFDCKTPLCQQIYKNAPFIADNLCAACTGEWGTLQEELTLLSVNYAYKPTLVRGLDYYNKTVFEFSSENLGAQNAFCGGGRYDQLIGQIGGREDQPSIGAAMGLERVMLLLEQNLDKLSLPQKPALQVIMPFSKDQHMLALLLADELHAHGITVETLFEGDSIKSMMKKANKLGAAHAIMLGEDEQKNKTVAVKNMITGEQVVMAQTELVNFLKK